MDLQVPRDNVAGGRSAPTATPSRVRRRVQPVPWIAQANRIAWTPWGRPVGDGGASGLLKHRSRPATLQKIARSRGAAARWCRDVLSGDVETAKSDPARLLDCRRNKKGAPRRPHAHRRARGYLILVSRNSTCFLAIGSYFFFTSLSVLVREFFLVT